MLKYKTSTDRHATLTESEVSPRATVVLQETLHDNSIWHYAPSISGNFICSIPASLLRSIKSLLLFGHYSVC